MSFFEDELLGRNNLPLPSMFYDVAAATPGVTPEDIADAVLAAWEAAPEDADEDRVTETYRKFILPVVAEYANANGLTPEDVCDALLTCAQLNESMEERRREMEEQQQRRRDRRTT